MKADELRQQLESSRRAIQRDYAALRSELDIVAKAKRSVVSHPLPWLGGSALVGWVLSGRKRLKVKKTKAGEVIEPAKKLTLLSILLAVARLLLPILRPVVTDFAVGKLASFTGKSRR